MNITSQKLIIRIPFVIFLIGLFQVALATAEERYVYSNSIQPNLKKWTHNQPHQKQWGRGKNLNPGYTSFAPRSAWNSPPVIINQFLYFQVIPKEIQEKIFIECKNEYSLRLVSKGFSCILNGRIYSLIPKELVKRSMTIFSYFINELPNLKLLDLGDIYIGEKGIQWLAKALIRNTTITALDLEGNDIGDEGAQWLAKVLMNNAKLKMLSLYNNNIGNEGAQSLSNALTSNTTLMTLNLGYNDITWSCPY